MLLSIFRLIEFIFFKILLVRVLVCEFKVEELLEGELYVNNIYNIFKFFKILKKSFWNN